MSGRFIDKVIRLSRFSLFPYVQARKVGLGMRIVSPLNKRHFDGETVFGMHIEHSSAWLWELVCALQRFV
jgi:hypothetical protein